MASYCYAEIDSNHHGHHPNTPCKACRLSTGADLPHPKPLGVVENRPLARAFSTGIFSNWTKLNAILKRFEPTIHKRWLKKSLKQRRDLLLSIVHDMPRVHRPDFEAWRKLGNARVSRERTCDANAHLWPYINLEDLLQGNNLLSFLNSRGHNLPETFASTDAKKASLGRGWQRACRSRKFVMVFDNKKTPRTYGSLVRLTTFPRGQRHLARIFNYHPNYGLLVLEIQQRVYDFLLRCAQAILHDFNPVDFLIAPHQSLTAVLDTKSDEAFKSISTHMVESEYRTPNKPSLERMKMLVESRLLATRDHLRGLREDPEYFLDSLKQWYDHHPLMPELDDLALWRDVAGSMIHDAVDNVRTWCCISRVIEAMRPIEKQMASAQVPGRFLREDDWPLWTMLSKCIGDFVGRPIFWIQTTFPRMPSIRSYYVLPHDPEKCDKLCQYGCESSWNVKCALPPGVARANKVFITLSTIHQSPLHSLHVCVQEAQYMLDHDKDASKFIDDWMHPFFSDLAVLADLQQSVDNFHPYSKTFTGDALCPNIENFVGGIADTTMCSIGASQRITKRACAEITSLGNPLDGRFKYPSEKRRTAESVAQMQRAEAALATFWADLKARLTNFDEVVQLYFDGSRMNPFATKDWQGQKATHLLKKRSPSTSSDETDYKNDTPFGSPTTAGSENKKSELTCKERSKTKTRGSASPPGAHPPPAPELQQEEPATTPSEPTQPIAIPRRAFKVMSALLPSPSTATQGAREIAWSEVLHAFCALGLAPEKLYGSVWIFRPGATEKRLVEVCRSIQWHEPKEVRKGNKIGARMVRRLGDRLKRAFGWDGETFCCAS